MNESNSDWLHQSFGKSVGGSQNIKYYMGGGGQILKKYFYQHGSLFRGVEILYDTGTHRSKFVKKITGYD